LRARERGEEATRARVVAFERAFHGRTCGALSATANVRYRAPFAALRGADALFAPFDILEGLEDVITHETLCVIVEPVQGEGGVHAASPAFLKRLRALCDATGTPLVFDEIQCGLGRTGHLFAYQGYDVVPDLLTLAKPLGGGLPCGAVLLTEEMAGCVRPGDHGTTFGGNPLACAVACALVAEVARADFLARVRDRARLLDDALADVARAHRERVLAVRGRGLMHGIDLSEDGPDAASVVEAARARGLILLTAGPRTLRLLPPLIVEPLHIELLKDGLAWALVHASK
jgi:acetylornithine/succinyldiaminopimelate/putrescine aminotransferase